MRKIEYNELRIGNLVEYNGKIYPVYGIMAIPSYNHVLILGDQKEEVEPDIKWVKPITLTEEWLLKFGFEKYGKLPSWRRTDLKEFVIGLHDGFGILGWTIQPQLEYVHQLQNLYFALTATELQISQPITT